MNFSSIINKILLGIIVLIVLILIITTAIVSFSNNGSTEPHLPLKKTNQQENAISSAANEGADSGIFQINQFRTSTAAASGISSVPVAISVSLYFDAGDTAFYEELNRKKSQIRTLISSYFSIHNCNELKQYGEISIKKELLEMINNELVLGDISAIYFTELMYLD